MNATPVLIAERRNALPQRLRDIANNQRTRIESFGAVELFLNSATNEAAFGEGFALFGKMRAAGEAIPPDFETLDSTGSLKGVDRRVVPFVRSNQFVALVATLEDYLSRVLESVLLAYPEQLEPKLSELQTNMAFESAIEAAASHRLHTLFYKSPLKYGQAIEAHLSMTPPTKVFSQVWPEFVEMKARRDIGVHANWRKNAIYVAKVAEVNGPIEPSEFLAVSAPYFEAAQAKGRRLVDALTSHCEETFRGTKGLTAVT